MITITTEIYQIVEIPDWIEHFQYLEELDLFDNKIEELPHMIGHLSNLKA